MTNIVEVKHTIEVNQMFLTACGNASFDVANLHKTIIKVNSQRLASIDAFRRMITTKDCPKSMREVLTPIITRLETLNPSDPDDIAFLDQTVKELQTLARPTTGV